MRFAVSSLVGVILLALPMSAFARNTEVNQPVEVAVQSDTKGHLLKDISYFMKGQKHPAVSRKLLSVTTKRSTRGLFRSDTASCNVAFLSAVRALQDRAMAEGGDSIIDITSITGSKTTESASEFRCVAGTSVVHVSLEGTIVKLK